MPLVAASEVCLVPKLHAERPFASQLLTLQAKCQPPGRGFLGNRHPIRIPSKRPAEKFNCNRVF